jgi:2-keto-4-pentenoate hydratase
MLDKDQIAAASRVLVQHWRDGSKFDALETRLRPQSRTEGYAVQAALGGQVFGWKIAATSEAGQTHINVSGPLAWLANELRGLGITLRAGEVVTTGTCHPPPPIQAGDHFAADFGVLGKVSARFA